MFAKCCSSMEQALTLSQNQLVTLHCIWWARISSVHCRQLERHAICCFDTGLTQHLWIGSVPLLELITFVVILFPLAETAEVHSWPA